MAIIKAYEYCGTIVVKYYDDGETTTLKCPKCNDTQAISLEFDAQVSEQCCHGCSTPLATISRDSRVDDFAPLRKVA